jgi:uncharacterized protein YprB with RNaseH-like and TPR domain
MSAKDPRELRRRLNRLGKRKKGTPIKPKKRLLVGLPEGDELTTSHGTIFRIESEFPREHKHGGHTLSHFLGFQSSLAAEVTQQSNLQDVPMERLAFVDTETTGLAGGAGTLAFLVGVGTFVGNKFRLRQYFLRDPAEEVGMLTELRHDLDSASGFVTYNGRAFDLPLLESRYTIALRERIPLNSNPHMDLLHLARRLWRNSLPNCTLGTVEAEILGVERTDDDVPGAWIPGMYLDYLRTGDATEMARVIYHNTIDILSLVNLTGHILSRHQETNLGSLSESEALAIARWHHDSGRVLPAETAFQQAITSPDHGVKSEALRRYSTHLKRENRRQDALAIWKEWHKLASDDPNPCIELAKYYEWEVKDLNTAKTWAQEAMNCLSHWKPNWRRDQVWEELEHRLKRIDRKLQRD